MKLSHLGFAASALIAMTMPVAAAVNLPDGSFEDPQIDSGTAQAVDAGGSIGPWKVIGQGDVVLIGAGYSIGDLSLQAKNGVQFVNLAGDQHLQAGVEQTFKTVPGKQYILWFRIGTAFSRELGFGPDSSVNVTVDGAEKGIFTVLGHPNGQDQTQVIWGRAGIVFTAANKETTIDFMNNDAPGDGFCGLDGLHLRVFRGP
jgi:hypothetical protein